jgi:ABC-type glycerol-3-phosphate transport system substrate-binding protein
MIPFHFVMNNAHQLRPTVDFTIFITLLALTCLFSPQASAAGELNWIGHWKDEEKREQLVMEIKKEFEFLYSDVQLRFIFNKDVQAEGAYYKLKIANTIVEMVQSGKITWDVVMLDHAVYDYVADRLNDPEWGRKHLLDIGEEPWFRNSQKELILDNPHYLKQTGGIFVGPYIEGFIGCLWYNREIAANSGIHVKERGMTVKDFLSYAKQLADFNRNNSTNIPFIRICSWNRLDVLFEYLYRSLCPDPLFSVEEKYSRQKEEYFLKTLQIFEELSRYQPLINPDYDEESWERWHHEILDDNGLFIVAGTYMHSHFLGIDPVKTQKIIPVESPYAERKNGLVGDYIPTFAVMRKSPNKEAALNLLRLWSEPKIAEKWISYTKNPTGLKGHLENPVPDTIVHDIYSQYIVDMDRLYGELPMRYFRLPTYIFGPQNPVTSNELRQKLAQILSGDLTAMAYYEDVMQRFRAGRTDPAH